MLTEKDGGGNKKARRILWLYENYKNTKIITTFTEEDHKNLREKLTKG